MSQWIPECGVGAIILTEDDRYILQRRDAKIDVWYPGHWGLFGGAREPGESPEANLLRELSEELCLLPPFEMHYFTCLTFDFACMGRGLLVRHVYEVRLTDRLVRSLELNEGSAIGTFSAAEIARLTPLAPHDGMALWMHLLSHYKVEELYPDGVPPIQESPS